MQGWGSAGEPEDDREAECKASSLSTQAFLALYATVSTLPLHFIAFCIASAYKLEPQKWVGLVEKEKECACVKLAAAA